MSCRYIVGIDPSKSNTGLTVLKCTPRTTKIYLQDEIFHPQKNNLTKYHFLAADYLADSLRDVLLGLDLNNTSISLESPVYRSYASEICYMLFQSILKVAYEVRVDLVAYAPQSLKSFARQCYPEEKFVGSLGKDEMKKVLRHLESMNPKVFEKHPVRKMSFDLVDSMLLSLLGLLTQMDLLPASGFSELEGLSSVYQKRTYKTHGFNFHPNLDPVKQFDKMKKANIKNEHLSLKGTYFYPFRSISEGGTENLILNKAGRVIALPST